MLTLHAPQPAKHPLPKSIKLMLSRLRLTARTRPLGSWMAACCAAFAVHSGALGADLCSMFPANSIFHQRIDDTTRFPTHPRNGAWLDRIGRHREMRPDWGNNDNPQLRETYYGIPHNVVSGKPSDTQWMTVDFSIVDRDGSVNGAGSPNESDCGVPQASAPNGKRLKRGCELVDIDQRLFPFPKDSAMKLEGGACMDPSVCGDRHLLVVESGACRLWEGYYVYKIKGRWQMYSVAAWDLNSNEMRPETWTSGDAAGLPILPFLARAEEASSGEIRHPLRVTFRDSVLDKKYVWPARHFAGNPSGGGVPFGALLRLRPAFKAPDHWTTQAKALVKAMKTYGLYVADIGTDFFVQGEPNAKWDPETTSQLRGGLKLDMFEFVDLSSITTHPKFNPDSFQSSW